MNDSNDAPKCVITVQSRAVIQRKQTKSENIFDIEFRLTRINQKNKRLKATAAQFQFSKEKHCYYMADSYLQIKDLLTENVSFI